MIQPVAWKERALAWRNAFPSMRLAVGVVPGAFFSAGRRRGDGTANGRRASQGRCGRRAINLHVAQWREAERADSTRGVGRVLRPIATKAARNYWASACVHRGSQTSTVLARRLFVEARSHSASPASACRKTAAKPELAYASGRSIRWYPSAPLDKIRKLLYHK
jgi:hypothetical protein